MTSFMKTRKALDRPTVNDLIAALSELPGDAPVRIEDADTYWTIDIIRISEPDVDGITYLFGEYSEMKDAFGE